MTASSPPSFPPKRPYLLRAMHEWISDCGHTPHVLVDAGIPGAQVPKAYVKDGKIVLNLSMAATQQLKLGNDEIEFNARFGGVSHHVRFPVGAVLGIYARETGDGIAFTDLDMGGAAPTPTPAGAAEGTAETGAAQTQSGPSQTGKGASRPATGPRPAPAAAPRPAGEKDGETPPDGSGSRRPQLRVVK